MGMCVHACMCVHTRVYMCVCVVVVVLKGKA